RVLDEFQSATPAQVTQTLREVLNPDARLTLRVVPQAETPAQNPIDAKPAILPSGAFAPQPPTKFTLSNGINVFYWHRPELPLMSVTALFNLGADSAPPSEAGRAQMAASMLDEGSGSLSAEQFQNALDRLGVSFAAEANH